MSQSLGKRDASERAEYSSAMYTTADYAAAAAAAVRPYAIATRLPYDGHEGLDDAKAVSAFVGFVPGEGDTPDVSVLAHVMCRYGASGKLLDVRTLSVGSTAVEICGAVFPHDWKSVVEVPLFQAPKDLQDSAHVLIEPFAIARAASAAIWKDGLKAGRRYRVYAGTGRRPVSGSRRASRGRTLVPLQSAAVVLVVDDDGDRWWIDAVDPGRIFGKGLGPEAIASAIDRHLLEMDGVSSDIASFCSTTLRGSTYGDLAHACIGDLEDACVQVWCLDPRGARAPRHLDLPTDD